MNKIRFLIVPILFISCVSFASDDEVKNPKVLIPQVLEVQGQAFINDQRARPRNSFRKESFLKTIANSKLRLFVDATTEIIMQPLTEIRVATLGVDEFEIKEIELIAGQLRVLTQKSDETMIKTTISNISAESSDYLISYNSEIARVEVHVFKGLVWFKGLEHESEAQLQKGHHSFFQAKIEAGAPVFDILMKGKRAVRGELGKVRKLNDKELTEIDKKTFLSAKVKPGRPSEEEEKSIVGSLCKKPPGKLNHCSWTCVGKDCKVLNEKSKCIRKRCLANGEWSDEFVVPTSQNKCGSKIIVGPCDY
jgi:hypothetical protein